MIRVGEPSANAHIQIMGTAHPYGSDARTRQLAARISTEDLAVFPIALHKINLKQWHRARGDLVRRNVEAMARAAASAAVGALPKAKL